MYIRNLLAIAALSASILAPSALPAAPADSRPPCILHKYEVSAVKPYKVTERIGRASMERLHGAQVYVAAQPGLTAEWLERKLEEHAQAMRAADMKDCVFDLSEVKVDVDSAGPGYWVKLIAKDAGQAQEVLRRARLQLAGS